MKIVNIKQNTREWKEWRGRGLGASDAPAVMGESPWTSPFELWLDKTRLFPRPAPNQYQLSAMRRGQELEPVVRSMYEDQSGLQYPSFSAHHDTHEFLRASFDGYNSDTNTIIEIKCPNKLDHAKAVEGKIPDKYVAQIQQQLLISNAVECEYVSFNGKDLATVTVSPDKQYQVKLLANMLDFWGRVVNQIPPEVSDQDVIKLLEVASNSDDLKQVKKIADILLLTLTTTKGKQ